MAIDELLRLELVQAVAAPREFRFRHPIVRRAVYESSGAGWRIAAHARAARELQRRGRAAFLCAHHVERSAQPGDEAAIAVLQEAAEATALRAPATAAQWLEAALRLVPETDRERRLALLMALARALVPAARLDEAHAHALEAIALLPSGAGLQRVRLSVLCAALERWSGRQPEAERRLLAVRSALPPGAVAEAVDVDLELLAGVSWGASDQSEVVRRVLAGLDRVDDLALRTQALATIAAHETQFGRPTPSRSEARALYDTLSDEQLGTRHGLTSAWLGNSYMFGDILADARHVYERAIAFARRSGDSRTLIFARGSHAFVLARMGEVARALEEGDAAVEGARISGIPTFSAYALWLFGNIALEVGDLVAAQRALEAAREVGLPQHTFSLGATASLGAVLLEQGAAEQALELLQSAAVQQLPRLPVAATPWAEASVRACVELGRLDDADRYARQADGMVGASQPICGAPVSRGRACLLIAHGAAAEAAQLSMAAAERAEQGGAPIQAARAWIVAGRALAQVGDSERATALLQSAHHELDRRGAIAWCDQAAHELRQLGVRVRRAGRRGAGSGVGSLSGRELEVARLVADGRTNREVAAALFLSEKTVEKHLARVFGKLGVSRRSAVAARLLQE